MATEYKCTDCGKECKYGLGRCRKCYLANSVNAVAEKQEARRIREELADARSAFLGLKRYVETGSVEVSPAIECPVRRCAKMFVPTRTTNGRWRKTCSEDCRLKYVSQCRQKIPEDTSEIVDMYVNLEMTGPEIAKLFNVEHHAIYQALERAGIDRHQSGTSHKTTCKFEGCIDPIYKIYHATNGSYYGSLCLFHRTLHRREINREYRRKINQTPIGKRQHIVDPECATTNQRKDYLCLQQGKISLSRARKTLKNRKRSSHAASQ